MPVMTTSWFRGKVTSIFLRLCSRAPMTSIYSWPAISAGLKALFILIPVFAKDYKIGGPNVTAQTGKNFENPKRRAIHGIFEYRSNPRGLFYVSRDGLRLTRGKRLPALLCVF